ncbi:hypothetical protein MRX96_000483 [Rhipicephalus microplus]
MQPQETVAAHSDDHEPMDLTQQLLQICDYNAVLTFEVALRFTEDCRKCVKLGEGCTADVYLIQRLSGEESAVKVIPLRNKRDEYSELPMPLASIIAEGILTRELSNLRFGHLNQPSSFIKLKGMYFVQGTYHPILAQSWTEYSLKYGSSNSNPSYFEETQLYMVMEFENGGNTLERFKGTIVQMESIILQVACSLAVAELELEFEHRDLHGDNVLVARTKDDYVEFMLNGRKILVRTAGVNASIIDYTMARIRKGANVVCSAVPSDTVLAKDTGSSQNDVDHTKNKNRPNLEHYEPHTNVEWLSYLLRRLIIKLPRIKKAAKVSTSRGRLVAWADAVLALSSAEAFVAEHVAILLERDAEVPPKKKRGEVPQTEKPYAKSLRTRFTSR